MQTLIVMRPFTDLYEKLVAIYAEERAVRVLLDRRYGDRRGLKIPPQEDRRSGRDRRQSQLSVAVAALRQEMR